MIKITLLRETVAGVALLLATPFRALRDPTMNKLKAVIATALVLVAVVAACLVLPFIAVLAAIGHIVKEAVRPSRPQHPF
jgi:hypothetical protein